MTKWGDEGHYNDMIKYFDKLKRYFVDKGIPVIITEVGVLTEEFKDIDSIINYHILFNGFQKILF